MKFHHYFYQPYLFILETKINAIKKLHKNLFFVGEIPEKVKLKQTLHFKRFETPTLSAILMINFLYDTIYKTSATLTKTPHVFETYRQVLWVVVFKSTSRHLSFHYSD